MSAEAQTRSLVSESPEQTMQLAAELAAELQPGDVVVLSGEIGSGKTVFVRGAAQALGFDGRVTSPTFAIGNVYRGGSCEIAHLDLYRLAELDTGDAAALSDYLTPERIAFVEWPHDQLAGEPQLRAVVRFRHLDEERREIVIEPREPEL